MDMLNTVLRSIRGETKSWRDHLDVFREFLDHLGRASRRRQPTRSTQAAKGKSKRGTGARHGDARRLRQHAGPARRAPNFDAVPARSGRAGRRLARTARGLPRAVRARAADSGSGAPAPSTGCRSAFAP